MTSATPWLGRKRVAFVPVFLSRAPPEPIPPDWENAILRRVTFDPRSEANGADRSLRAWLRAASSGRADIDPLVLPMQTIDQPAVSPTALEDELGASLRDQGVVAAVLVTLGGLGTGINRRFWSRVAMAESNGVWLMQLIQGLTGFKDLSHFNDDVDIRERAIGRFDEMSAASQAHPTAFTKNELGWVDARTIPLHAGASVDYQLQHVSLAQPPLAGHVAAVRIGYRFPYMMVEARKVTDQFEAGLPFQQELGIGSEGVIAYRVQTRNATAQERENHKKPLFLMMFTALRPGESMALDDTVSLSVTAALPDGFAIRINARHFVDRTVVGSMRESFGSPCVAVIPGFGIEDLEDIAYCDIAGHLSDVWRSPHGQGHTDITATTGAPEMRGNPFSYFDPLRKQIVLLFRGPDNHVRRLDWFGAGSLDNLTRFNAPKAEGNPVGWYSPHDRFHHVVYRTADGHLHEVRRKGEGLVLHRHRDLTAKANAVPAAGDPWPYYDSVRSTNIVVFKGIDRRIRSLYWRLVGAVGEDDLSGSAGTPLASGHPFAWFTRADDTHRVVYRTANGHLHQLFWRGVKPVNGRDLTALSGAPRAAGNISGGYNPADNTQHVIFRSADGRLHDLWHVLGETAVHHVDLTAAYAAPGATDRPAYYASRRVPHHRVAYRGANGHIYELLW